ncbi:MAG TPA: BTAD domain-containing putative transcriptional regulator [Actinocrinis sp.]|nr:BTAD domain-containing putative transcriptional regulator [Actinocrinis sp.]
MRFALLGRLEVSDERGVVQVRGGIPGIVLATLLWNANTVVSVDRLADLAWRGSPPPTATASLYNHMMRLRRLLGDEGGARIRAMVPGYLIRVEPGELDVDVFAGLCAAGRQAAREGRWARASADLTAALALWRGEPFADLPGLAGRLEQPQQLQEARRQALEGRIEADLALGRHEEAIGELRALVRRQPLNEAFQGHLMTALYRSGRQAEALDVFLGLRRVLVNELGVEPSAAVQELHQRILRADPGLLTPVGLDRGAEAASGDEEADGEPVRDGSEPSPGAGPGTDPPGRLVPAQLPAAVADFTGRAAAVKHLCDLLSAGEGTARPGEVTVCVVTGAGGIGKTALAIHVAHRVKEAFPDGQLYVDLRGADKMPRDPGKVLGTLLRDLGVPVPESSERSECAARALAFRTAVHGRRLLIVLDNARDAVQVRPLLPGGEGCGVLVTSRSRLPGLAGAAAMNLDALDAAEAAALFGAIAGPDRVAAEPQAAAEVVRYCAGLPLAVRIAAARLASRPGWTVADLAGRLADERRRLRELSVADLEVYACFQMSYAQLEHSRPGYGRDGALARAARLLGLFPGPYFTVHAAAALLDAPLQDAEDLLEALVDANLLETPAPSRYRPHDLLRVFLAERARAEESPEVVRAAVLRLGGWYVYACRQALAALEVGIPDQRPHEAVRSEPPLRFTDPDRALAWFDAERPNLLAVARAVDAGGTSAVPWLLTGAVYNFYNLRGLWDDWIESALIGLRSARADPDPETAAHTLVLLGYGLAVGGWPVPGLARCEEGLAVFERTGNLRAQVLTLETMAAVAGALGRSGQRIGFLGRVAALRRELGSWSGLAVALGELALAYARADRYEEFFACCDEALPLARAVAATSVEAALLEALGEIQLRQGQIDEAIGTLGQAAAAHRRLGSPLVEAYALEWLGVAYLAAGRPDQAQAVWDQAYGLFEDRPRDRADGAWDRVDRLGVAWHRLTHGRPAGLSGGPPAAPDPAGPAGRPGTRPGG